MDDVKYAALQRERWGGHVVPLSEAAKLELGSGFLGLFPLLAPGQLSLKGREKQVKDVPT